MCICVQSVIWGSGQKRVWDLLKQVTNSCKHPNMGSRNQTQDLCEDSKCFLAKSYLFSPSRGTVCEVDQEVFELKLRNCLVEDTISARLMSYCGSAIKSSLQSVPVD